MCMPVCSVPLDVYVLCVTHKLEMEVLNRDGNIRGLSAEQQV